MGHWKTIADIRREYGSLSLNEDNADSNPIVQFGKWFAEVIEHEKDDPTAMVLSTVDELNRPDSRVVLLKETKEDSFVFFTNYHSAKSIQIEAHPYVALNFYWPQMARQVRVRGNVRRISSERSNEYFSSRPKASQISAIISPQSKVIKKREQLEQDLNELIAKYQEEPIVRPDFWGGYEVIADELEFWQGRDNRLHDRIHYYRQGGSWQKRRLAP